MVEDGLAARLARAYVAGWRAADNRAILNTLDPHCVVIESHGPTYRGSQQVERWIESWFGEGNTIDRWDMTSLLAVADVCAFEWFFSCSIDGVKHSFEGASFVRIGNEKIVLLREYRMTEPPYEWTG